MSSEFCWTCRKNAAKKPRNTSFVYKDLQFKVFKSGNECESCVRKECIETFEETVSKGFIRIKEGVAKVNWKIYSELFKERNENAAISAINVLISLGILSFSEKGNWDIVTDSPISSNPLSSASQYLYFTRKEDAIEFAQLNYIEWKIRRIGDVLAAKDVL